MPVLTYDITIGTKKAKRLNLSHNFINEIRKSEFARRLTNEYAGNNRFLSFIIDVLGNLSSVEVLDLSHNDLDDLNPEKHRLSFPENLTELNLSGNRLIELPSDALANLTKLSVLNVDHNRMEVFNYTLLSKISSGLTLLISGETRN